MDGGETAGMIIWLLCTWGCGALFLGIGIYAARREKPMWFWSGSTVDPKTVRDIPAYNRANGRMWTVYSIPYWLGGASVFWGEGTLGWWIGVGLLLLACFPGIGWLIWKYRKIEKEFIQK